MQLQPYTKTHLSATDLVQHVQSRGLIVPDINLAARVISEIGYHRLRIYFLSRRQHNISGKPFDPNTSFQEILEIYHFDERLRMHCFMACGRVEIIFRNTISELLSEKSNPHPYFHLSNFKNESDMVEAIKCISDVYLRKTKSDKRAEHYFKKYNPPMLPPIWIAKDLLTFGGTNTFYNTLAKNIKDDIAAKVGLPNGEILTSWIKSLIDLRNICGHHDRLFNRSFQKQPTRVKNINVPSTTQTNKLFSLLECIQFIVSRFDPGYDCISQVRKDISSTPSVRPSEVGF